MLDPLDIYKLTEEVNVRTVASTIKLLSINAIFCCSMKDCFVFNIGLSLCYDSAFCNLTFSHGLASEAR